MCTAFILTSQVIKIKLNYSTHKTDGVNRTKTMRFYPYVFTGKERDEETGYGYFGARYMDHELMTMWLSVDPMADKYPSISPYAYCVWNPLKLVDPNGMDTLLFNKNGILQTTIPAKGVHVGKMAQEDGSFVCFSFADPEHDVEAAHKNLDFRVRLQNDETIKKYIEESKVDIFANSLKKKILLPYFLKLAAACEYLLAHSNAGINPDDPYTLDYTCRLFLNDDVLYVTKVGGIYIGHNGHNFGNFLWGASTEILRVPLSIVLVGAHYNNWKSQDENGGTWDSADDQLSISLGYIWAMRNKL